MERYAMECKMLAYLARRQLNLPKNIIKDDYEKTDIHEIFDLLHEEKNELFLEIFESYEHHIKEYKLPPLKLKKDIDFNRLYAELGDFAANLVGLLAWINEYRDFINDDCA